SRRRDGVRAAPRSRSRRIFGLLSHPTPGLVTARSAATLRPGSINQRGPPMSMSKASLPVFETGLNALLAVLEKGEAHAAAKKFDTAVLLNTRLAPHMFALTPQVQVATDMAKNGSPAPTGAHPAPPP